jgi:GH15 family glucan-1,4-alpha-glucosidase
MTVANREFRAPPAETEFPEIGDYAPIGDCRTIALVSKDGGIEWLCLPHFSGPSFFAAALDREGGHFTVRPTVAYRSERAYLEDSNVLRTRFICAEGTLDLVDCISLPSIDGDETLEPQHEVLRELRCVSGEVPVEVCFAPRPDYGRCRPRFASRGALGWQCTHTAYGAFIRSEIALFDDKPGCALRGTAVLQAGDVKYLSFAYDESEICALPPLGMEAGKRLAATAKWWRGWAACCTYTGKYREQILRSLLALKLLTSCTSGAVMAAATTSLPEWIGGERNWDYRFCWLRDSALTLDAFISMGYADEAEHFLAWLLHATRLTLPKLQVMYDLYGETRLKEKRIPWLGGYRNSQPVRVGNAAHEQLQLDIYGELILAVERYVEAGGELDRAECRMLAGLAKTVCKSWRLPDHGIWETRREARHHTFSKGMCWLALQSLQKISRRIPLGLDVSRLQSEAQALREEIEAQGYNESLGAYVGYYGGEEPDASVLMLARHGYQKADHPRMAGTYRFLERTLSRNGLLYRFAQDQSYDGLACPENAFGPCSFWAVEHLAGAGRRPEAVALFERLLGCANDVGIYAEEFDPANDASSGNTPQAFTHVSMISAALALDPGERSA